MYTLIFNGPSFPTEHPPEFATLDQITKIIGPIDPQQAWTLLLVHPVRSLQPSDKTWSDIYTWCQDQFSQLGEPDGFDTRIICPTEDGPRFRPLTAYAPCLPVPQIMSAGDFGKIGKIECEDLQKELGFVPVLLSPYMRGMSTKERLRHGSPVWMFGGGALDYTPSHGAYCERWIPGQPGWYMHFQLTPETPAQWITGPPATGHGTAVPTAVVPLQIDPAEELREAIKRELGSDDFSDTAVQSFKTRNIEPIVNYCARKGR